MISRDVERKLPELARGYPILSVTGPRQSGKTTLVRHAFPDKPYVSLENPAERAFAAGDPEGFLARFPDGAILDEAQRVPDLFSYLQIIVDEDPRMGLFVLTGSNQFYLMSGIAQSLAGRVALIRLLPFSYGELAAAGEAPRDLHELLVRGLFPPIYDRGLSPASWYGDYVATYLERDVRQMVNVRDLLTFQRFLQLSAAATGQLLNLTNLSADVGVSLNTVKSWLSVLEASYVIHRLPPYFANLGKRVVRTPKLYFVDTGLAAWLMGITGEEELEGHPNRGALFETWVIAELLKRRFNHGLRSNLWFWRDQSRLEVDVLMAAAQTATQVEIKAATRISGDDLRPLLRWRDLAGTTAGPGFVVYGGEEAYTRLGIHVVPWREITTMEV